MKLDSLIVEEIERAGLWVDYYAGYPRCSALRLKSNNWRRMHGISMKRRRK